MENRDNTITSFLTDYKQDKLNIEIDLSAGIFVLDEKGGVMRELEFNKEFTREEAVKEITSKLKEII